MFGLAHIVFLGVAPDLLSEKKEGMESGRSKVQFLFRARNGPVA